MKITCAKYDRRESGMFLIDCIVYCALFFVILGLSFEMFYACWDNAKGFRRNADEIVGTLRAGERWRDDVRSATAQLRAEDSPVGPMLQIPQRHGEITYLFADGTLWRRANPKAEWTPVLLKVKTSRMEADKRAQVTAWRWEIELATQRKGTRVLPLFTFEAVPPHHD